MACLGMMAEGSSISVTSQDAIRSMAKPLICEHTSAGTAVNDPSSAIGSFVANDLQGPMSCRGIDEPILVRRGSSALNAKRSS